MGKQLLNIPFLLLLFIFASAQTVIAQPDSITGSATGFNAGKGISGKKDSIGGRLELSITEFITSKLPDFMRIYSARLLEKPGLSGKINFNFAIDEFGNVPFCNILNSAIDDDTLENRLADFIISWKFDTIDKPGDVTIVTYPFDFSQENKPGSEALAVGTDSTGGRSKESIFRAIKTQSSEFKKIYHARLADKPGLKGKIYFKFAINELGSVVYCKVDSSTVNDETLENKLAALINRWKFEKTDIPGDIIAVNYPFVFSAGDTSGDAVFVATIAVILSLCLLAAALFIH
jgi:hypothetical protein